MALPLLVVATVILAGTRVPVRDSGVGKAGRLGTELHEELRRWYPPLVDPSPAKRVSAIGYRLARAVRGGRTRFRFHLLNGRRPLALAAPGGRTYITTGMVAMLDSDDQLAFVLAHEMGHLILGHDRTRGGASEKGSARSNLEASWWRSNPAVNRSLMAELEADRVALRLMRRAGLDPSGAERVLDLVLSEPRGPGRDRPGRAVGRGRARRAEHRARVVNLRRVLQTMGPPAPRRG